MGETEILVFQVFRGEKSALEPLRISVRHDPIAYELFQWKPSGITQILTDASSPGVKNKHSRPPFLLFTKEDLVGKALANAEVCLRNGGKVSAEEDLGIHGENLCRIAIILTGNKLSSVSLRQLRKLVTGTCQLVYYSR